MIAVDRHWKMIVYTVDALVLCVLAYTVWHMSSAAGEAFSRFFSLR